MTAIAGIDTQPDDAVNEPGEDELLISLEAILHQYGQSIPKDVLIAGLPLVEGRMTADLFVRAAERAGCSARLVKRRLSRISRLALPAVVLLKDDGACVLQDIDKKGRCHIYLPADDIVVKRRLKELKPLYAGHVILIKPEYRLDDRAGSVIGRPQGHWFWSTVVRLWPTYVQILIAALIVNILALAAPLFIMNVYDRVLPNQAIVTLWVLAAGMGLALTFDFLLKMLRGVLIDAAGRRADVLLASRIFEQILNIKLEERPETAGAFASHIDQFEIVREFFTSNTLSTIIDILFLGLFFAVIYYIAGPLVWVPIVAVTIVVLFGIIIQFPLYRAVKETQLESAHRHSLLVEVLSTLETVKSVRAESQMQSQWERFCGRTSRTTEKVKFWSSTGVNVTSLVQQMVTVGVVVGGVHLFTEGDISMGAIIATVILAGRAVGPLGQFALTMARCQQAVTALRSLNRIMKRPVERSTEAHFLDHQIKAGKIQFDHVSFEYPNSQVLALNDFSFTIEPGERVGLIGRIGSGKSTVGRLLSRLYTAQQGTVLIDDVDIRQYHPHEVRRAVAFVIQDADLFYGTVRENIVIGVPHVDDETMLRASRLAGVDAFVRRHPLGYDLPVGERGQNLSGGQRQAIALARAFLFEPPIMFLDEPSSSMDMATEQQMIRLIKQALKSEQTLLVATHRNSMLDLVDRLIVLENGRVVADGPKAKVIAMLAKNRPKA
jgi:ATP-binding cassette subfamily C protein LapB